MKRTAIYQLLKWDQTSDVRPVLITGAKGVGKTYLAHDFSNAFFKRVLYLNFEHDPFAGELFNEKDPFKVSKKLLNYFHIDMDTENPTEVDTPTRESRVLILDEISHCPKALSILTSLQYTGEFPRIIAISSSPIDKEKLELYNHIPLYPMQFDEFLVAMANEWYIETIFTHYENNKKVPEIVHKELLGLYNLYLQIGGMPGIINEYLNFKNLSNIPERHSLLIGTYQHYLSLIDVEGDGFKMNQVLNCLPLQLIKENKKFQYKLIRKGTTHSMYKEAIQSLSNHNYVIPSYKIVTDELTNIKTLLDKNEFNISDTNNFKLYQSDVGLLYTQLIKQSPPPFKKAVTKGLLENYIAITLEANGYPTVFWESDSMAKVDFIIKRREDIVPIEAFIGKNTRSKNVSVLKQKIDIPYSIKISAKNFDFSNKVKYVPYYATFCI